MGDCNIRISFSESLLRDCSQEEGGGGSKNATTGSQTIRLASDATVADVLETRLDGLTDSSLGELLQKNTTKLWDCTYYPPKDITQDVLQQFPEKSGPRSLTLFDAGWFVSGTLLLAKDHEGPPRRNANYDDVQYNAPTSSSTQASSGASAPVQLKNQDGGGLTLPSQLLQSVKSRFVGVDVPETDETAAQARSLRRETEEQARQRELARQQKLLQRIQKLDTKGGGVAGQVQRMLIKSRATGRANLAEQDRIYLRVVVDRENDADSKDDNDFPEDFRYFSRQDVVGKILSEFPQKEKQRAELLIQTPGGEARAYLRLSNLMRFHEVIDAGHLANFDRVIVRLFDPTTEEPTTSLSILSESKSPAPTGNCQTAMDEDKPGPDSTSSLIEKPNESDTPGVCDLFTDEALAAALDGMEKPKKRTTKSSSTSSAVSKVRHMQIKSKAKGDVKRIKMPDRFFLEVVVASRGSDGNVTIPAGAAFPCFMAAEDPLQRLVKDGWVKAPLETSQFLILTAAQGEGSRQFRLIQDPSQSPKQLTGKGVLSMFDRLIVYY